MERRFEIGTISKAALAVGAGAMMVGACSNDESSKPRELEISKETVNDICSPESRLTTNLKETIGTGPFAINEAMSAEVPSAEDIRLEHAEDLKGNVPAIALLNAQFEGQGSDAYSTVSVITEALNDEDITAVNDEKYIAACESVIGEIKASSEYGEFSFTDGLRLTYEYDEDGGFATYKPTVISGRYEVEGIFVRNERNEIKYVVNEAGEFIYPKGDVAESGNTEEEGKGVDQENGEVEVPVTYKQTPDNRIIAVTIDPDTGEEVAVNPETGEPTGEPIPPGSTTVPNEGEGTDNEGTDNGTGEGDNGSGDGTTGGGANGEDSGDNGAGDGTDGGGGGSCGDGCGDGGGDKPEEPTPGTTTTTVRPTTTTTTVRPTTTTTTVRPTTTTTTVRPTTTTTTVRPTTTTTTTTTPPTTTTPTTTTPPTTTTTQPWKPPIVECDPVIDVCD
jgi:hypothetical protein